MKFRKKLQKNRAVKNKWYRKGFNDAVKEWKIKYNDQRYSYEANISENKKEHIREVTRNKKDYDSEIDRIKKAYQLKERRLKAREDKLSKIIWFWTQEADALRKYNLNNESCIGLYQEKLRDVMRRMGELQDLENEIKNNNSLLHTKVKNILKKEPKRIA
jgi:hypothetical protein